MKNANRIMTASEASQLVDAVKKDNGKYTYTEEHGSCTYIQAPGYEKPDFDGATQVGDVHSPEAEFEASCIVGRGLEAWGIEHWFLHRDRDNEKSPWYRIDGTVPTALAQFADANPGFRYTAGALLVLSVAQSVQDVGGTDEEARLAAHRLADAIASIKATTNINLDAEVLGTEVTV